MTLAPRVVVVHRRTELDELLARHGTHGQAAFFLSTRGRDIADVEQRHAAVTSALSVAAAAIPVDWRRGTVERADLARFLFSPDDIIVVVGQDGLVANVAKSLAGQRVVGVDPEPGRNPGILVPHSPAALATLLPQALSADVEERTMVQAVTDDGRSLTALNELYVGQPTHQTARYVLSVGQMQERQGSSGVIVATGTGATGWCSSVARERHSPLSLPAATQRRLAWYVREAWPSPTTGTALTEGLLGPEELLLTAESDRLVCFGDGIESDALTLSWGQSIRLGLSPTRLHLVR